MIQFTNIIKNADGSWTFLWNAAGDGNYRVVLWGIELSKQTTLTYTWTGQEYADFPPPLEVVSGTEKALSEQYLPYMLLQWYGEPESAQYEVQQLVAGSWRTIRTLQEVGLWIYTYRSVILADETQYQFRVVAFDIVGNQSDPRLWKRYVICPPVPPDGRVSIVYAGGQVTVNNI